MSYSDAIISEGFEIIADIAPLLVWRWFSGYDESDYLVDEARVRDDAARTDSELVSTVTSDPTTFACSTFFAIVLYGFTLVQACRFFLPATLVVHFIGIATVEPARAHPLSLQEGAPSLREVLSALFLDVPAVVVTLACGIASRAFIFSGGSAAMRYSTAALAHYRRRIAVRTVALSLAVGLDVFLRCKLGIPGVDTAGAAAFASIWSVAPLLVGAGLGYAGV